MPDWITNIGLTAAGLPWWAVFALLVLYGVAREVVPASLKLLGFNLDREKYRDSKKKQERDALADELRDRIDKLEKLVTNLQEESREDRVTGARLLADEKAAHAKCQIEQEQLRGDLRVQNERLNTMQVQLDRLLSHDQKNAENVKKLADVIKEEVGKTTLQ